jgi:ParB family chromosome partitioning protein
MELGNAAAQATDDAVNLGRGTDLAGGTIGSSASTNPANNQQVSDKSRVVWYRHRVIVDQINIPPTHRAIDPHKVEELAKSMAEIGLLHAIIVRDAGEDTGWELVAGGHRLEAARLLEWDLVDVVLAFDEIDAKLITITENLHRAELTVLERSEQVAEWGRLIAEKRKRDESVSGQVVQKLSKRGREGEGRPEGGISATARDLNISRKEVERSRKIDSISPEAKEAARAEGIDDNQSALLKVAAAPAEQQVETVEIVARGASSVISADERKAQAAGESAEAQATEPTIEPAPVTSAHVAEVNDQSVAQSAEDKKKHFQEALIIHAQQAEGLAKMFLASFKERPTSITVEAVDAARSAVRAWLKIVTSLRDIES